MGFYLLSAEWLWKALAQVGDRNQQGEIYLTDLVGMTVRDGRRLEALQLEDSEDAIGVNTRVDLAAADAVDSPILPTRQNVDIEDSLDLTSGSLLSDDLPREEPRNHVGHRGRRKRGHSQR